ncbi:FtsK/SpoIIIE domain-containing protein [Arthrobacter sp. NEB 688]|uniref:FtsK/SpoIIIE domain-containing protein n=1 Tax=Arthrobacter sp. NEB 688 TaxID=904039 RepID=UPI0015676405|nr:FtsK/SpoIIIE domain-containing protein [Arthrobacter sp. NEB 688]QKE85464.1 FHA domain-containing protein [Arthrobacter sp. NEB 688]
MEIRATVHVPRRAEAVEVAVRWSGAATAGDLEDAVARCLGVSVPGLLHDGAPVATTARVGSPPLLHGASLVVADPSAPPDASLPRPPGPLRAAAPAAVLLATVAGPDAGRSVPLRPPGLSIGRSAGADLQLADASLSRVHCRIEADPSGVRVRDVGSTNGLTVDGRRVEGAVEVDTTSEIGIGASVLRLRRAAPPGPPRRHPGDGTARVVPATAPAPRRRAPTLTAPPAPTAPPRARLPWVAALAPLPIVLVLAVVVGPQVLAFALLGPVVLLSTGLGDRVGGRRRHRHALADHDLALARHRDTVAAAIAAERRLRLAEHPDAHEVLQTAEQGGPGLWSRVEGPVLRLGLGRVEADLTVVGPEGQESHPGLEATPVRLDLGSVGSLHVVGAPEDTAPVLRHLVGQVVTGHGPRSVSVRVLAADGTDWTSLGLLPHAQGCGRTLLVIPDATAPGAAEAAGSTVQDGGMCLSAGPVAPGAGAVLSHRGGGRFRLAREPSEPEVGTDLVPDGTCAGWLDRVVRALAPLREDGAGASLLPSTVTLAELTGLDGDPDTVLRRWATSTAPTATLGLDADGPWRLDLRRDGPHVLVGGTTGSGKSELLRTLVTGLALDSPPDDLTMILVDFKGGAAFGPCIDLPHVVGLVTDLDAQLVDRMLLSLSAELRRRERVLAELGAADLDTARRGRPSSGEPLPRLVVVVDEVRALVDEHPDAVAALVRLAAQGRSLGIHLVLATQRPTGTLGSEVQANVSLRIAFRVRDRGDSSLVVESDDAALIPASLPGRGVRRGGDGVLRPFQAALVAPARTTAPVVEVHAVDPSSGGAHGHHGDGDGALPAHPPGGLRTQPSTTTRDDEVRAVVDLVRRAAQALGSAPPRRPWLPPLPAVAPLAHHPHGVVALVDEPDRQRRSTWGWSADVAGWRVTGASGSGRTTALRTLVLAALAAEPALTEVQVIAPPGLEDLMMLPAVGSVVDPGDPSAVDALLTHLEDSTRGERGRRVLLVVDGVDRLDDDASTASARERLLRLLRDTPVTGLLSGGRELLRPTWSALGGETLLLGRPDVLDAALLGLPVVPVSSTPPAGRGCRPREQREAQVLLAAPADVAAAAGRSSGLTPPWTYRPFPPSVTRTAVLDRVEAAEPDALLLGLAGAQALPWGWRPGHHGRLLLVTGRVRSGRSGCLRVLARSATDAGRPVVLVVADPRVACARTDPGTRSWEVLGPDDTDRLVALRTRHPDLLVLVDDAHLLDDAPVRPALEEIASLVDRDAGALAVTSPARTLAARVRGLDVVAARRGTALLLRPGPDDAALVGASRAAVTRAVGGPPGRGLLVVDGESTPLQVIDDGAVETGSLPAGRGEDATGAA